MHIHAATPAFEVSFSDPDFIIHMPGVVMLTGLSSVSIWRKRRAGEFPPPIQLSTGRIGWKRQTVLNWVNARRMAK